MAVAAVVAGTFSLVDAGLKFVLGVVGGAAIGLAVGWLSARIRARNDDPQISIAISLLTGYAAFVPANAVGARVWSRPCTAGLYMGIRGSRVLTVQPRLQGSFIWEIVDFLVNAILFV